LWLNGICGGISIGVEGAEVLSDVDAELAGLKQRRDKTHALKQGMMQKLLTGKTRIV
jgi:type I restriction enzyme S subunit